MFWSQDGGAGVFVSGEQIAARQSGVVGRRFRVRSRQRDCLPNVRQQGGTTAPCGRRTCRRWARRIRRTAPSPAFASAMPEHGGSDMSSRAARSPGVANFSSERAAMRMPCRRGRRSWIAPDRDVGFEELRERIESGAGGDGGREIEGERGSTSATRGSMRGLRRLTLTRCSGEPSTALRVTSAPVPAVVGMAMKGALGLVSGRP